MGPTLGFLFSPKNSVNTGMFSTLYKYPSSITQLAGSLPKIFLYTYNPGMYAM